MFGKLETMQPSMCVVFPHTVEAFFRHLSCVGVWKSGHKLSLFPYVCINKKIWARIGLLSICCVGVGFFHPLFHKT